eukprot:COSAG02_NODE_62543_length_265_cov_1.234940_1_plen_68_part_01
MYLLYRDASPPGNERNVVMNRQRTLVQTCTSTSVGESPPPGAERPGAEEGMRPLLLLLLAVLCLPGVG